MFEFDNLDDKTRELMLAEANIQGAQVTEYFGKRLTPAGVIDWPELLRSSLLAGTPESLAVALGQKDRLKLREISHRKGVPYEKAVPVNAAELLAEGEFNRYYCRAICVRGLAENRKVVVYRGRHSENPRPESEAWVGKEVDPKALLDDLRNNTGGEPQMGLPSVNSGLSVRLA